MRTTTPRYAQPLTLLLRHTDGPSPPARRLGVLTADAQAPVVAETPVRANLLEALQVLAQLRVDTVGKDLVVLTVDNVALPVEEPCGDLVLRRVLDDGDDTLELFRGKLAGAADVGYESVTRSCCLSGTRHRSGCARVGSEKYAPLVEIDVGLLTDQVGVPATDTLDLGQGVHDLLLAIDVGVQKTQDELEVRLLASNESCSSTSVVVRHITATMSTYT